MGAGGAASAAGEVYDHCQIMGGHPGLDLEIGAGIILADRSRVLRVVATQTPDSISYRLDKMCSRLFPARRRSETRRMAVVDYTGTRAFSEGLSYNLPRVAEFATCRGVRHVSAGGKANRGFGMHAARRGWRGGEQAPGNSNFELKREVEPAPRDSRSTVWASINSGER
ncbi:hypothetical protein TIFTF001_037933 [Ficus carica]|uniref:Uncharacterized protein n=1 Tax=Ficus carica TaxID=3494 RepID=A0AA88E698_FICCA|nr:hypothetical protein TIFTF001_037920 [Ficus carica]GMN68872.1 hypothetical protein TIFTF001_037923 [Ficus carica]GMN68877.1 hypothetical protein TIFTF001_037930 [Ficus carica]GMN68882.1 hypothetical protein TIFTF001_037933 [Ficus carica]